MPEVANELVLTRLIDAPREKLFRCWTEPALLKRWFAPAPVTTPIAEVDLRVGGANRIVMTACCARPSPVMSSAMGRLQDRRVGGLGAVEDFAGRAQ
jgi:hypothetical protein